MIVLAVLGVLAVLMVMILNLSDDAGFAAQMMMRTQAQDRAYYVAASAARASVELLANQDEGLVTLADPWARELPPLVVDGYAVSLRILDEERFFNPNAMVDRGSDSEPRIEVFRRLLRELEQPEDLANAVLDWIDTDANRRQPGGAEGLDYRDRHAKNSPVDSVEELGHVLNLPAELMSGRETSVKVIPGLREVLTIHSNGKVNVNTAHPSVLRALAPDLSEATVSSLMERRLTQPFKDFESLLDVPGVTRDHLFYLQKVGAFGSQTWRVEATVVRVDDPDAVRLRVTGVYRKARQGFQPLSWNLGETTGEEKESSPD